MLFHIWYQNEHVKLKFTFIKHKVIISTEVMINDAKWSMVKVGSDKIGNKQIN